MKCADIWVQAKQVLYIMMSVKGPQRERVVTVAIVSVLRTVSLIVFDKTEKHIAVSYTSDISLMI